MELTIKNICVDVDYTVTINGVEEEYNYPFDLYDLCKWACGKDRYCDMTEYMESFLRQYQEDLNARFKKSETSSSGDDDT